MRLVAVFSFRLYLFYKCLVKSLSLLILQILAHQGLQCIFDVFRIKSEGVQGVSAVCCSVFPQLIGYSLIQFMIDSLCGCYEFAVFRDFVWVTLEVSFDHCDLLGQLTLIRCDGALDAVGARPLFFHLSVPFGGFCEQFEVRIRPPWPL